MILALCFCFIFLKTVLKKSFAPELALQNLQKVILMRRLTRLITFKNQNQNLIGGSDAVTHRHCRLTLRAEPGHIETEITLSIKSCFPAGIEQSAKRCLFKSLTEHIGTF